MTKTHLPSGAGMEEVQMSPKAQRCRDILKSGEFIVSPGVYDGYGARIVEADGFKTAAINGAAVAGAR